MSDRGSYKPIIDEIVRKCAEILGDVESEPEIVFVDRLSELWLGQTVWSPKNPNTTTIELQTSVLKDDRTLERVLAHEMIHHWEMIHLTDTERTMLRYGTRPPSHGERFMRGAALLNSVLGENFVTRTSDQSYVKIGKTKPYYLLIIPTPGYIPRTESARRPFGYAWAVKIGDQARLKVEEVLASGGKLVHTTDPRWTDGPKIQRFGGMAIPSLGTDESAELARLATTSETAFLS